MLSIIVLVMNDKWLHNFHKTLEKHSPGVGWELIVVANGCEEPDFIKDYADKYAILSHNVGYSRGNNIGARLASHPYLSFQNDDMIFTEDIYTPMLEAFAFEDNIGICSVATRDLRYGDEKEFYSSLHPNFVSFPVRESDYKSDIPAIYETKPGEYVYIMLMPTPIYWELGGLDDSFVPLNYEDVDLSFRARQAGYKVVSLTGPSIKHIGGGTVFDVFGEDVAKYSNINRQRFIKKWGHYSAC